VGIRDVQAAAQVIGLQLKLFKASTPAEIDAALASMAQRRPDALLIGSDPFFVLRRKELTATIARLGIVAVYPFREFIEVGGLISYGRTSLMRFARRASIPGGFSRAPSLTTFRSCSRPGLSW
jgi:hypothetical protein